MAAADPAADPATAVRAASEGEPATVSPATVAARDLLVAALNRMVNAMAGRDDLLLECVWNAHPIAGQPDAPAWFVPADLTVTLNAHIGLQGADPAAVDPLTAAGRRGNPVLVGLLAHESGHAHSTRWPDDVGAGLPAAVTRAVSLLEEPRIEYRQVTRRPQDRPFLRACASTLLDLDAFATGGSRVADRWAAATAAALVLGRVDAGVLDPDDVDAVVPVLRHLLGEDDLRALTGLWRAALDLPDGDVEGLIDLATRWVAVVGEPPSEAEMPRLGCHLPAGPGPAGEDAAAPDPADADPAGADPAADPAAAGGASSGRDPLVAALDAALSAAHDGAREELEAELSSGPDPAAEAARAQADEDDEAQRRARDTARAVFGDVVSRGAAAVTLGAPRPPTEDERVLARAMGEALRRARFRDRSIVTRTSAAPPGRLNGREAMLGMAQRSRGALVTARPFRSTVRRRVPEPPVTLGIAIDVSGSMRWAEDIMATVAWAGAHAVTSVHGRSASVVFGSGVAPLAHPGCPPTRVTPFCADASWENFSGAFDALDGALNLTRGVGVRLLVVVSDGHFVAAGQPQAAQDAVTRMRRGGGHVLWIPGDAVVPDGATAVEIDLVPAPVPGELTRPAEVEAFHRRDAARRMARIPEAITTALTAALHT
jgi:hypothetical protein